MKNFTLSNLFTYTCLFMSAGCIIIGLTSCCNFTMSNVMTDGTASDVIDETDSVKSDPTITPKFSMVPM